MRGPSLKQTLCALCLAAGAAGMLSDTGVIRPAEAAEENVEAQLQEVEDELEIRRLLSRYGHHLDDRNLEAYAALFAENGEWIGGFGRAQTPAGILKMLRNADLSPNRSRDGGHASVHVMTNAIIDVDGDSATALSKFTVLERGEDGAPRVRRVGHYRDKLVREDGVWKFQQRIVYGDIPSNNPMADEGE